LNMSNFIQFLLHLLVISAFLLIFVLATVFTKPLMINRKRMVSTMFLKIGYLIYLIIILTFFYYLIFVDKELTELITDLHFVLILLSLFVPNVGMMMRRRVKNGRTFYNCLLTTIFILTILYLSFVFYQIQIYY
jgi:uncharacterized membrane protein YqaE (UPF0057 family)